MHTIDRRTLLTSFAAAAAAKTAPKLRGAPSAIDDTLRSGIARHKIPAVVGMAASEAKTLYSGAFGIRDSSGVPVKMDSIFAIASMTKAVTTVAALQLVEQGKVRPGRAGREAPSATRQAGGAGRIRREGQGVVTAVYQAGHAAPPADAHQRLLLRHVGRGHVPLRLPTASASAGPDRPADVRARKALAIRPGLRLGRQVGGGGQRGHAGRLFSREDSSPAWDERHELHSVPRGSSTGW